jgi:hypothetical protein
MLAAIHRTFKVGWLAAYVASVAGVMLRNIWYVSAPFVAEAVNELLDVTSEVSVALRSYVAAAAVASVSPPPPQA